MVRKWRKRGGRKEQGVAERGKIIPPALEGINEIIQKLKMDKSLRSPR